MYRLILAIFLSFFTAYALLAMEEEGEEGPMRVSSIRRSDAKKQLVEKTTEQKIDDDYYEFISNIPGFEHLKTDKIDYLQNPKDVILDAVKSGIALRRKFNLDDELPPGKYSNWQDPAFAIRKFGKRATQDFPKQGWKIHISALPYSAQKIAASVLMAIEVVDNLAQNNPTYFKIINSIPAMRSLYYITGNLEGDGRETQVGKFITIYPENKKHAKALVKEIDRVFSWDKRGKKLNNSDFYKLSGEAQIGETGWVYIRYGNMNSAFDQLNKKEYVPVQHKEITVMPPKKNKNIEIKAEPEDTSEASGLLTVREIIVKDDRFHPWPDFMNKGDSSWKDARDPFRGLNLRWNNITWENRPNFWDDIKIEASENLVNNNSSKRTLERKQKRLSLSMDQK